MAFRSSPTLTFVFLDVACVAQSIYIVSGTPFLSIVSLCSWTLMMGNDLSAIDINFCRSDYPYRPIFSFPPLLVACQQTQIHSFQVPRFCKRDYCIHTCVSYAPWTIHCQLFLAWNLISPKGGHADCGHIYFWTSPMVSPTVVPILLLQVDRWITCIRDWSRPLGCINVPECYTHTSEVGLLYPRYAGGRIYIVVSEWKSFSCISPPVSGPKIVSRGHRILHSKEST